MPNIFIDPYVFACPSPTEGLDGFRNYINNIISWRDLRTEGWASLFIPSQTAEILAKTNSYPPWDDLSRAIKAFKIEDVQPKDIHELISSLLNKVPTIEDSFSIKEVLFDDAHYKPTYHLEERAEIFVENYRRLLVFICIILHFKKINCKRPVLISRDIIGERVDSEISVRVIDCEYETEIDELSLPISFQNEVSLCSCPMGVYLSVEATDVWKKSKNNYGCYVATRIALIQYLFASGSIKKLEEYSWSFNSEFYESAKSLNFFTEEGKIKKIIQTLIETILKTSLKATHALRSGPGPEDPQVKRGDDAAWRRDIDYDYHLHYWETPDGPEMASVVIHKNMKIPY